MGVFLYVTITSNRRNCAKCGIIHKLKWCLRNICRSDLLNYYYILLLLTLTRAHRREGLGRTFNFLNCYISNHSWFWEYVLCIVNYVPQLSICFRLISITSSFPININKSSLGSVLFCFAFISVTIPILLLPITK